MLKKQISAPLTGNQNGARWLRGTLSVNGSRPLCETRFSFSLDQELLNHVKYLMKTCAVTTISPSESRFFGRYGELIVAEEDRHHAAIGKIIRNELT